MFAVEYRTTMKNAKFQPKKPEVPEVPEVPRMNIVELRAQRVAEAKAELDRRNLAYTLTIRTYKEEADRLILQANTAMARLTFMLSFETILRRICRATKISPQLIFGEQRSRQIVFARQAVMYWTCRMTGRSLPQIGMKMGGRDHTTIINGRRKYPQKRAAMGRHLRSLDR